MGDRDDEVQGRQGRRAWVAVGGHRTDSLFWTSPQIRTFPARPPRDAHNLFRIERDAGRPGGDAPK
jgi:hypothetical protein